MSFVECNWKLDFGAQWIIDEDGNAIEVYSKLYEKLKAAFRTCACDIYYSAQQEDVKWLFNKTESSSRATCTELVRSQVIIIEP